MLNSCCHVSLGPILWSDENGAMGHCLRRNETALESTLLFCSDPAQHMQAVPASWNTIFSFGLGICGCLGVADLRSLVMDKAAWNARADTVVVVVVVALSYM